MTGLSAELELIRVGCVAQQGDIARALPFASRGWEPVTIDSSRPVAMEAMDGRNRLPTVVTELSRTEAPVGITLLVVAGVAIKRGLHRTTGDASAELSRY